MKSDSLVHFKQQVAGHDKLMSIPSNDLILIKPCTKKEYDFYQDALNFPDFLELIPECYGTLRAATEKEITMLESSEELSETIKIDTTQNDMQNLCLENILHGFTRPCILDLKMGSLLYDNTATEEKRQRMIQHSLTTTSSALGLRICGMKVYDSVERKYATYPKAFGKSRTKDTILDALMAYLFPTSHYGKETESYRTYQDDTDTIENAVHQKIPTKYIQWVIECFIDTLTEIREAVIEHPNLELIGSSLLFVYEGDRSAADATWKFMLNEDKQKENSQADTEEDENAPKMCDVRLIDFAHSSWHASRETQDPELIKGFDNMLELLEACLQRQQTI
ncbi:hypothetical protein EDC96DRAFT_496717 [Choanephora cucurbitarum]|nr:hypothetical protein EDC96DRAFT_496717 [Choanephora cucurbitarum]